MTYIECGDCQAAWVQHGRAHCSAHTPAPAPRPPTGPKTTVLDELNDVAGTLSRMGYHHLAFRVDAESARVERDLIERDAAAEPANLAEVRKRLGALSDQIKRDWLDRHPAGQMSLLNWYYAIRAITGLLEPDEPEPLPPADPYYTAVYWAGVRAL